MRAKCWNEVLFSKRRERSKNEKVCVRRQGKNQSQVYFQPGGRILLETWATSKVEKWKIILKKNICLGCVIVGLRSWAFSFQSLLKLSSFDPKSPEYKSWGNGRSCGVCLGQWGGIFLLTLRAGSTYSEAWSLHWKTPWRRLDCCANTSPVLERCWGSLSLHAT